MFFSTSARHTSLREFWFSGTQILDSCFVCHLPLSSASASELRLIQLLLCCVIWLGFYYYYFYERVSLCSSVHSVCLSLPRSLTLSLSVFVFCHNIMEFILWPTGRKFVVLLRSANFAFTIARPKAKGHQEQPRRERKEQRGVRKSVYKCKYGHNVGHTVCAAFFPSLFLFFLHFLLLYFVVIFFFVSVFFIFFLGASALCCNIF